MVSSTWSLWPEFEPVFMLMFEKQTIMRDRERERNVGGGCFLEKQHRVLNWKG